MWVEFTKTYAGPWGLFPKGHKFDLPDKNLKAIRKELPECFKKCPAPWDVQKEQSPAKPKQPAEPEQLAEPEQPVESKQPAEPEPTQEEPSDAKENRAKSPKRQPPKKH